MFPVCFLFDTWLFFLAGSAQFAPRKKKVGYIPTEPLLSRCGADSVDFILIVFWGYLMQRHF